MIKTAGEQGRKKGTYHGGRIYIALVMLITSIYLLATLPHIDDITHNTVLENNSLRSSDMADSYSELDHIEGDSLVIEPGEGLKLFAGQISLQRGDALRVHFTANNKTEKKAKLTVDLYGEDFDDPYDEFSIKIPPGEKDISQEIEFYRNEHPDACTIRIFTSDSTEIEITDFSVDYLIATKDNQKSLLLLNYLLLVFILSAVVILAYYLSRHLRNREIRTYKTETKSQEAILYSTLTLSVTLLLLLIYKNADLAYPLVYAGGDEMGVYYFAKTIDQNGFSLANPYIGGISGGDLFDYPYSDSLSFLLVKIIGVFSDNPYLIINLFYFTNLYLIALISVAVSRKIGLSRLSSFVIGLLFAFSPYYQMRYSHMWLTAYYMLPVACLLSINIIRGRIPSEEDEKRRKAIFWCGMIMSFICAFTGMYYAYFSCAIIAAAMVIRIISIQGKELRKELYPVAFIGSTIAGVLVNVVPNLLYWAMNGTNPSGELAIRNRGDAETYGLKLVQMILPRTGHRIELFSKIANGYFRNYPLVNENSSASIGIIASIGLIISLLLLFSEWNKYKEFSWLNLATFIIATIGGLGSIISVAIVIPMRCYNRMSLIIMFLSLLLIGSILDRGRKKKNSVLIICASLCILAIGLFDQTVDYAPYDNTALMNTKALMADIDRETEEGDFIFALPYLDWPSSGVAGSYGQHVGYLETDNLHWSYGAMQGRGEAQWQKYVSNCEIIEMIERLKFAGYDGIYLNRELYESRWGSEKTIEDIESITQETGHQPLVSEDLNKFFWKL